MSEENKSYIVAIFKEKGSALVDIQFQDVTAGQVLALASMLEAKGKAYFMQQEYEEAMKKAESTIARPSPGILKPK